MSDAAVLYLDSSALVKLYVTEPGTDNVRAWVAAASASSTSRIAHVEVAAAVARRTREQVLHDCEATAIREALETDLDGRLMVVELSVALAVRAAMLTVDYPLRGMDAIHLASALWLQDQIRQPIRFVAWDVRLADIARGAGLDVTGI